MGIWRRFWKNYWIALQRSRKDLRARQLALRVTFLLVYLAGLMVFYVIPVIVFIRRDPVQGVWTAGFYVVIMASGSIAAFLIRRSHRRDDELLSISFTEKRRPASTTDAVSPAVQDYLVRRILIIAATLARAGSEVALRKNEADPERTVVTRQTLNGRLRTEGLWDLLEPNEADLMRVWDGDWPEEQRTHAMGWCEQLRLLQWTLGIESEITPLSYFPALDFGLGTHILSLARAALSQGKVLRSWDLRMERDIAQTYAARIVAELHAKGFIEAASHEDSLKQFRAKLLGASTDILVGSKTIEDLSSVELGVLLGISSARAKYAAYLVDQLDAVEAAPFVPEG